MMGPGNGRRMLDEWWNSLAANPPCALGLGF